MSAEKITSKDKAKEKRYPPVDPANDFQMVNEGLRPPLFIQDPEWHKQTGPERIALGRMRKIKGLRPSAPPTVRRIAPHRITVHLKNLKQLVDFKTTYSDVIYQDEIGSYLDLYFSHMKEEIKVVYFNGKKIREN
jgi:hypothetical protein